MGLDISDAFHKRTLESNMLQRNVTEELHLLVFYSDNRHRLHPWF
ncbi:hypothetical protein XNC1_3014 [Xenorhabdus nematophila ATCC 19061]|uniref:Uncharacterized protein n=1 Tax=Xenorhabdus nematophila (strain ATCC 19061 / DSM 3370 / CCUG 14189 / LMG 1036 / NCIMB 9965 / AN6) TaxID=406817 RepID=D3VK09_XENNA|nr:hypothetical protein [Xenorhabdus nematophila]CEE93036.1 hypothetical protein XNA1_3280002 [Xenorhabdus nematophila str. Anatoliense]CBJ91068.1 hypothetical protein XNC1_3014 [Xenorhabdus nematophila ATCC 19061]CEK21997.1 hypothetical protein XNC2_1001 [Xenorhabdus nematophila AN6/1]CEK23889.1 hypothetical protein XNC2_2895 [Xenorhabdus nematophila AN6/1]CEK25225.1 hypothetical protein XNC2_4238 [Xenorhabdus nematophila AN6/1]